MAICGARKAISKLALDIGIIKMTAKHEPTDASRSKVCALTSFGITQEDIALYLGICVDTLAKHYRFELDTAVTHANSMVANKLFKKATEGDELAAQIFWLKTRGRWREKDAEDKTRLETRVEQLIDKLAD